MNDKLDFILFLFLFYFYFLIFLYFIFEFLFFFFILDLGKRHDVMLLVMVTQVTKHNTGIIPITGLSHISHSWSHDRMTQRRM